MEHWIQNVKIPIRIHDLIYESKNFGVSVICIEREYQKQNWQKCQIKLIQAVTLIIRMCNKFILRCNKYKPFENIKMGFA